MVSPFALVASAVALCSAYPVAAQPWPTPFATGNDLARYCRDRSDGPQFACLAFILGVRDTIVGLSAGSWASGLCVPVTATAQQVADVVKTPSGTAPRASFSSSCSVRAIMAAARRRREFPARPRLPARSARHAGRAPEGDRWPRRNTRRAGRACPDRRACVPRGTSSGCAG